MPSRPVVDANVPVNEVFPDAEAALAAAHEEMVGVELAVAVAAIDVDGVGQAGGGLHLVGSGHGQRLEDVGGDIPTGAGAQIDAGGLVGVEDGALRQRDGERPVAAGIAAHARREDAFHRVGGEGCLWGR